jgi:carbamoyltransferase
MKIIIGLNSFHADSSACLIKDNTLKFGIEEERINRIKHWAGFPAESIKLCLKSQNLNLNEVTDICINTNPTSNISKKIIFFLKNFTFGKKKFEIFQRLKNKISLKNYFNNLIINENLNKKINIHYIDHHLSHISSSYFASGFDKAMGLSIDGFGDFCSIAIAKCTQNKIKIIKKIYFPNSLGVFYEAFTQLIGFKNYGDEYKMMGLSSYGESKLEKKIEKVFNKIDQIQLDLDFFNHSKNNFHYKFEGTPNQNFIFSNKIFELLEIKDKKVSDIERANIAYAVQKVYEKIFINICKEISNNNFSNNLVLSGGCALNSLANKKLFDENLFKNIFIPYAPGDAGGAIGSALYTSNIILKNRVENLKSPYIGPKYSNSYIKELLRNKLDNNKFKLTFNENKNILLKKLAIEIFNNSVVGIFNGEMEFGARALGNRSIIANPCNPNMKEILNLKIKRRENFRPFAPAILEDYKNEWFNNSRENLYMSAVELINNHKRNLIPAVTHIDGTGRIQTVSKKINKDFYNLIFFFMKISKVPILLNTSFNENEPIVMTPENALNCFLRTKMDCLLLENFLIERS